MMRTALSSYVAKTKWTWSG